MNRTKNRKNDRRSIRALTTTALLTALMLLLSFTSLGFIPIGAISITIVHLPVLIGLFTQGLPTGLVLGALFGVISLVRSITTPTGLFAQFFWNPLVSVLPRVLIVLAAWGAYRGVVRLMHGSRRAEHAALAAGSLAGTLVNTLGVLGVIYIISSLGLMQPQGFAQEAVGPMLLTVALTNGIPEAIISAVIAPIIVTAVKKSLR